MLLILVYIAENFSVNLKMVYIAQGTSTEVQYDATVTPQKMRYQKPPLMTGNVGLQSPKTRAICTGTKAGLIDLDQVSGDVSQEEETDSGAELESEVEPELKAEPESQAVQMVGIMSFREQNTNENSQRIRKYTLMI